MISLARGTVPLSRGRFTLSKCILTGAMPRRPFVTTSLRRPLLLLTGSRTVHAATVVLACVGGATFAAGRVGAAQMEAPPVTNASKIAGEKSLVDELLERIFGKSRDDDDDDADEDDADEDDAEEFTPGRGKPVHVPLDPEILASLPVIPLSQVQNSPSSHRSPDDPLLVTHEGIVYDVSSFAAHHPGGRDLLLTAGGLDLSHFFRNYAVHGRSDKAARWLAPLAVGKLSDADRRAAEAGATAAVHVERRHRWLTRARRRIVWVAATLPLWMTVRTCVRWVG
mmetsp:Transcript_13517/g.27484  ORF Transcript_13517/g.27484 Transcript_13517/m.27484 type:complete len:282 (-) Transcript_13517:2-847(-)